MNSELPPVIQPIDPAGPGQPKPGNVGRIGLQLAFVAPVVFLLFMVLRPG